MRLEHSDTSALFEEFSQGEILSLEEAHAELRSTCGRFRTPITTEENLRAFIAEKLSPLDTLPHTIVKQHGVPFNWQKLVNYLHEQKIIQVPRFLSTLQMHDRPHIKNVSLLPESGIDISDGREIAYFGYGGAFSLEEAMSKAVGETLERFYMCKYSLKDLLVASFNELKKRNISALDISELNGFLPWQIKRFPNLGADENSPLRWVEGSHFPSNEKIMLPAQLVYWTYVHAPIGTHRERILAGVSTSGCAGHFTRDEAVLSALNENIERDGFLMYWLNGLTPRVIDVSSVQDPKVLELLASIRRYRLEVKFVETTTDIGVPSLACVIIDNYSEVQPVISVGSAAGFNLNRMLAQSMIESLSINAFVDRLEKYTIDESYVPFTDGKITRAERLSAWKGLEMYERMKFFISGTSIDPETFMGHAHALSTPRVQLNHILERFRKLGHGYEVYIHEAKNNVLDTIGYHAVRVIVPKLMHLYLVENIPTLNSERLRNFPKWLAKDPVKEFTPWPHPFP